MGKRHLETLDEDCTNLTDSKSSEIVKNCLENDFGAESICRLGICSTDGFCFKSVVRRKDHTRTTFRCQVVSKKDAFCKA